MYYIKKIELAKQIKELKLDFDKNVEEINIYILLWEQLENCTTQQKLNIIEIFKQNINISFKPIEDNINVQFIDSERINEDEKFLMETKIQDVPYLLLDSKKFLLKNGIENLYELFYYKDQIQFESLYTIWSNNIKRFLQLDKESIKQNQKDFNKGTLKDLRLLIGTITKKIAENSVSKKYIIKKEKDFYDICKEKNKWIFDEIISCIDEDYKGIEEKLHYLILLKDSVETSKNLDDAKRIYYKMINQEEKLKQL